MTQDPGLSSPRCQGNQTLQRMQEQGAEALTMILLKVSANPIRTQGGNRQVKGNEKVQRQAKLRGFTDHQEIIPEAISEMIRDDPDPRVVEGLSH